MIPVLNLWEIMSAYLVKQTKNTKEWYTEAGIQMCLIRPRVRDTIGTKLQQMFSHLQIPFSKYHGHRMLFVTKYHINVLLRNRHCFSRA